MRIYTRTGDRGETGLIGGARVRKDDPLMELVGTLDELNSAIGFALTQPVPSLVRTRLTRAQHLLFDAGAEAAGAPQERAWPSETSALEAEIDSMTSKLPPLQHFILPGGGPGAASLHVARSICRRTERVLIPVVYNSETHLNLLAFVNRLSDWLFCAARLANLEQEREDVRWKKQ